jgi:serine protease AprX
MTRVFAVIVLAATGLAAAPAAHAATGVRTQAVIVESTSVAAATRAVVAAGGSVDLALPLVRGVAAHVSVDALAALDADATLHVVPDLVLHPTSASFEPGAVDNQVAAMDPGADWSPDAGRGVTVALVDTGVADTSDLRGSRLVRAPDFSGEGDGIDHYGHGTFVAGLIAGDGSASPSQRPRHFGVAPGATLVSVKVAGADGSTTVSRVIAGIGWVVVNRDAYNIGVLNLSFGVDASMKRIENPLSGAVEAAWASGIAVVASAGNEGTAGVTSPGTDPYVITVGSTTTNGTATTADDSVASFSGRQQFHKFSKPDVVAPGVSVVSLRAPGSTIDVEHPEGRVDAAYFRGTGTSMSTALVAGAAAVLLSHHPAATPDDIKGALLDGASATGDGALAVDLDAADHAPARPAWWQHFRVAFDGLGEGLDHGMPWSASRWTASRWTATRWTATRWTATRWTASRWTASRWTASRWTSSRWTASAWPAQAWG